MFADCEIETCGVLRGQECSEWIPYDLVDYGVVGVVTPQIASFPAREEDGGS